MAPLEDTQSYARGPVQARMKTMRTGTGVSYRVVDESNAEPRAACSASSQWLAGWLQATNTKAYTANVNLMDPKQRRPANEVADWCQGEELKLWSPDDRRPLASLTVQHEYDKAITGK